MLVMQRFLGLNLKLPSMLMWRTGVMRKTGCYVERKTFQSSPQLQHKSNFVEKIVKPIQNDPFVKLSLSLCVIIIGGTVVAEMYKKLKKRHVPTVLMAPPGFGHHSIKREALILQLWDKIKEVRSHCRGTYPIVYITGSPASGKTELVRQFCIHFSKSSNKWFGLKPVPSTVLYLNASSPSLLELSLAEALHNIGLQQVPGTEAMPLLVSELSSTQLPWLIVVDNLMEETESHFQNQVTKYLSCSSDSCKHGAVLVTSTSTSLNNDDSVSVPSRLSLEQSLDLLENVSDFRSSSDKPFIPSLLEDLCYHPMAIALAAATIKIYNSVIPPTDNRNIVNVYHDLLIRSLKDQSDLLQATLDLYYEAAAVDPRLMHTFDFIGSCAPDLPLPVSVIPVHLRWETYAISEEMLFPPPLGSLLDKMNQTSNEESYWTHFKSFFPFLYPKTPSDSDITALLKNSQDQISYLRQSPVFSFKCCCHGDIEFIKVHSIAFSKLSHLFTKVTSLKLDQDHITNKAKIFERSAWFKMFRTFDEKKCLDEYHRMLPGLSSPGVLTQSQFKVNWKKPSSLDSSSGTEIPHDMDHTQYLHVVSHYHRVISSLTSVLRAIKGNMGSCHLQKYMMPHLQKIGNYPLLSKADKLATDIAMLIIEATSSSTKDSTEYLSSYEKLVSKQKILLGSQSIELAQSLVDLADLHLSVNNPHSAQQLLQSALDIYRQIPAHLITEDLPLQVGHVLASTSIAYEELGDKEKCKSFCEEAFGSYQSIPSSGKISDKQRRLVASQLVDVTHAYLRLGDINVSRKYSELASTMLQGLYPQGHTETIRLFGISSIISALSGNREESNRFRIEASKMKTKLDSKNVCKI